MMCILTKYNVKFNGGQTNDAPDKEQSGQNSHGLIDASNFKTYIP